MTYLDFLREFNMNDELIIVDNSLVTSAYNFTLNEQRLILCALKKIEPKQTIEPQTAFYITRDDFIELGANPDVVAQEIRQATKQLLKKTAKFKTPVGVVEIPWLYEVLRFDKNAEKELRALYPNPSDFNKYINYLRLHNLIDSITHNADDNIVARVVFHDKILPLLCNLKQNFTQYLVADVADFKSSYSHRIYQLMMQYKSTNYVKISISDLRFMLEIGLKYPLFADMKRRVIDTAVNEINDKSPYNVKANLIKKGRKFAYLELKFEKKEKQVKSTEYIRDENTLDMLSTLKMTDKQRLMFANKLSELPELSRYAPVGMEYKDYAKHIANELLDPAKAEFYRPYLAKIGFIGS